MKQLYNFCKDIDVYVNVVPLKQISLVFNCCLMIFYNEKWKIDEEEKLPSLKLVDICFELEEIARRNLLFMLAGEVSSGCGVKGMSSIKKFVENVVLKY